MEIKSLLDANNAAIVMRQHLKPVEGDHAVVFPPTFAEIGYNIDEFKDVDDRVTKNVCLMDSVGSQANRMEPIFKNDRYAELVPRITITVKKNDGSAETVDILDAGHRIADAVVRFSDLSQKIEEAFQEVKKGNAVPLAKLSPTSLVFGCWDSRSTGVKLPRIVRSTIRALDVNKLTRSAAYMAATNFQEAEGFGAQEVQELEAASEKKEAKASTLGLANALANQNPGGVLLDENSELLREAVLSLSALRRLAGDSEEATASLRAYILGLALVAFTAPQDTFLRMGCELTPDPEKPATWEVVRNDGTRTDFTVTHDDALAFALEAARDFGVGESLTATFDPAAAKKALKDAKDEKDKKKATRKGK